MQQAVQPPGKSTLPPEQGCGLALQILATLVNCAPVACRPELTAKLPLFVKVWAPASLQQSPARPVHSVSCPFCCSRHFWRCRMQVEYGEEAAGPVVLAVTKTYAQITCTSFAA